ncbi:hypothetical protein Xen7305DRAFT_00037210 [Xenococcus sp. PCC 7305]|uniref:PFE-CTERM domain-containing protein n=1 Tax=Xenococcus sp. PCC 7305 TaxID=102125 RepID=UPI0002ABBDBB|nr:hypothetical protein [Xenococcus sp. PCC 7305]ELS03993.1 hypothetical protein Xen7305DRAFT_00037210 [Xenococcus sp. PCC 7305]
MNGLINSKKVITFKGFGLLFGCLGLIGVSVKKAYAAQLVLADPPNGSTEFIDGVNADLGVDSGSDGFTSVSIISGNAGETFTVLNDSDNVNDSNTVTIDNFINTLNNDGITSTNVLVFGLGINEPGSGSSIHIERLTMAFQIPNQSDKVFSLNPGSGSDPFVDDTIVAESLGSNTDDAKFRVDFGFDFIAAYNGEDPGNFQYSISTQIQDQGAKDEEFYLSSGFTAAAVPFKFSPTLGILLSLSLLGVSHGIRLKKFGSDKKTDSKKQNQRSR